MSTSPENQDLVNQIQQLTIISPTFHQFTKLPTEIRDQIWKFASDVPRLFRAEILEPFLYTRFGCCSKEVPAVLHTCQESRQQALKSYDRWQTRWQTLYINHEWDIIYFETRELYGPDYGLSLYFSDYYFSKIKLQRFAISLSDWKYHMDFIIYDSASFPNLKEILILDFMDEDKQPTSNSVLTDMHPDDPVGKPGYWQRRVKSWEDSATEALTKKEKLSLWNYEQFEHDGWKENAWLEEGRVPPVVKVMKVVEPEPSNTKSHSRLEHIYFF